MTSPSTGRSRLPVSVVVPAYNAAATLSRALDSVRAQTCLPSEIIIVDDASIDATWDIIQRLSAEHPDPPIRTVRLARNGGPAAARNVGWTMANQEFLAFLDADDAWHPRKLELQYRWLAENARIVLCGHRCIVTDSEALIPVLPDGEMPVRFYGINSFLIANRLSTPSVMVRRRVSERFADGKRGSEDYSLWLQIVANHGPAAFIDLPLAFLFKARYGAAGLSGDLWRMHLGELDSLSELRRQNIIGLAMWLVVLTWSWMKFLKRAALRLPLSRYLRSSLRAAPE